MLTSLRFAQHRANLMVLEVVSKRQIAFESKAQANDKAQSATHSGG
jgi:hypothetical protein